MSHFQIHAKFDLSVKNDGEAYSCSVSHILTLGPQEFVTFFIRKCDVGHFMLAYQPHRLLNVK